MVIEMLRRTDMLWY